LLGKTTIWIAVDLSVGILKVAAEETLALARPALFDASACGRARLGASALSIPCAQRSADLFVRKLAAQ
jgi:hypothetical protein